MAMGFWFESFNREMPTKAGKRRERSQVKWLAKLGAHAKTINSGRPTPREPQFGELVEGPVGSKVTRGISPFRPGSRVEDYKVRGFSITRAEFSTEMGVPTFPEGTGTPRKYQT